MYFSVAMRVEAENGKQTIYHDFFSANNKHEAIGKALESFIRGGAILECTVKVAPDQNQKPVSTLDAELIDLCRGGRKINAIKLYREKTNTSLLEAKEYVEKLSADNGIQWR